MKLVKDEFNSDIFQMKMGNVVLEGDKPQEMDFKLLREKAAVEEFRHLTVKIPSYDKKMVNAFLKEEFYLADTLVEYVFELKKARLPRIQHLCSLQDCRQEELPVLKEIARKSFQADRFHCDGHLSKELCDKYYEKWIENSYYGFAEKVITAKDQGKPVGFTTGKTYPDDPYGHLVLSAVSDECRGRGVYTSMIHEGVSWILREHGDLKGVIVGTQIDTLAVQKAWVKLGFTVYGSFYVLHRYLGDGYGEV